MFHKLSNNILFNISQFLSTTEVLNNFALVNKQLNSITQPKNNDGEQFRLDKILIDSDIEEERTLKKVLFYEFSHHTLKVYNAIYSNSLVHYLDHVHSFISYLDLRVNDAVVLDERFQQLHTLKLVTSDRGVCRVHPAIASQLRHIEYTANSQITKYGFEFLQRTQNLERLVIKSTQSGELDENDIIQVVQSNANTLREIDIKWNNQELQEILFDTISVSCLFLDRLTLRLLDVPCVVFQSIPTLRIAHLEMTIQSAYYFVNAYFPTLQKLTLILDDTCDEHTPVELDTDNEFDEPFPLLTSLELHSTDMDVDFILYKIPEALEVLNVTFDVTKDSLNNDQICSGVYRFFKLKQFSCNVSVDNTVVLGNNINLEKLALLNQDVSQFAQLDSHFIDLLSLRQSLQSLTLEKQKYSSHMFDTLASHLPGLDSLRIQFTVFNQNYFNTIIFSSFVRWKYLDLEIPDSLVFDTSLLLCLPQLKSLKLTICSNTQSIFNLLEALSDRTTSLEDVTVILQNPLSLNGKSKLKGRVVSYPSKTNFTLNLPSWPTDQVQTLLLLGCCFGKYTKIQIKDNNTFSSKVSSNREIEALRKRKLADTIQFDKYRKQYECKEINQQHQIQELISKMIDSAMENVNTTTPDERTNLIQQYQRFLHEKKDCVFVTLCKLYSIRLQDREEMESKDSSSYCPLCSLM
jgi:hypothetical protein